MNINKYLYSFKFIYTLEDLKWDINNLNKLFY